jgi:hypothetical protein
VLELVAAAEATGATEGMATKAAARSTPATPVRHVVDITRISPPLFGARTSRKFNHRTASFLCLWQISTHELETDGTAPVYGCCGQDACSARARPVQKAGGLRVVARSRIVAGAAKVGNVVCLFQSAQKFKTRYATVGFSDKTNLDEGAMWPTAYGLQELTAATEARIGSS